MVPDAKMKDERTPAMVIAILTVIFGALTVVYSSSTPRSHISFVSLANNVVEISQAHVPDAD